MRWRIWYRVPPPPSRRSRRSCRLSLPSIAFPVPSVPESRLTSAASAAPRGLRSDSFDRLQPPGLDRADERLVVLLVLIRVRLREVGDRLLERVAQAQVLGHGDRVPGPGVRTRQRPTAHPGVEREPERHHPLDQRGALHVAELPPVEVALHVQADRPAEVDIAGSLHDPLSLHHPLAVLPVPAPAHVGLQHRRRGLLDLKEQRVLRIAPLEQDDERPGPDAADADDLAGRVHELETLQQLTPVILQGFPVGTELITDRLPGLAGRQAVGGGQVTQGDDDRRLGDDPILPIDLFAELGQGLEAVPRVRLGDRLPCPLRGQLRRLLLLPVRFSLLSVRFLLLRRLLYLLLRRPRPLVGGLLLLCRLILLLR